MLADIPGTTNITHDNHIFAENTKQHDETLTQVYWNGVHLKVSPSIYRKRYFAKSI